VGPYVRARALGLIPDCILEPATPRVPQWLHATDIFVLPSLSEALSNSLMQAIAIACGCPVVASRVGSNPELVTPGETCMLFEPRDAVGLAQVLGPTGARSRAEKWARFTPRF